MRTAYALLTLLFTVALHAAVPIGAVRINTDTTGTNTHSSAITVTGQTNLFAGTLNATNSVNVGRPGEAGLVTVLGTNNVAYVAIDPTNTITFGTNIFTYGPQPNTVLSGLRLTGNGDPASTGFYFEEADSLSFTADAWIEGYAYIVGTTNAHTQLDTKAVSPSGEADFTVDVLSSATNRVQVQGLFAGKGFTLLPTAGESSTPYTLDTSVAHTSRYLVEFLNNSTDSSKLWWDGTFNPINIGIGTGGWLADPDGGATFKFAAYANGAISASQVQVNSGTASTVLQLDPEHISSLKDLFVYSAATNKVEMGNGVTKSAQFDASATANDTRLLLWDVTANTLVRVSRGAVDSGGAGFRVLRIPN